LEATDGDSKQRTAFRNTPVGDSGGEFFTRCVRSNPEAMLRLLTDAKLRDDLLSIYWEISKAKERQA
jgi:hypothetical protein